MAQGVRVKNAGLGRQLVSGELVNLSPLLWVALLLLHSNAGPAGTATALVTGYYSDSCPQAESIVQDTITGAFASNARSAASILRLQFHDCFVQGCDASLLLKDTQYFTGEQGAKVNRNSLKSLEVIDDIKYNLEQACPGVVSCADILAFAARDAVVLTGGPWWDVLLGRRDSSSTSSTAPDTDTPFAFNNLDTIKSLFKAVGLSTWDLAVLSGAHTIGLSRCVSFDTTGNSRLYNWSSAGDTNSGSGSPDPNIDPSFLGYLQSLCPPGGDLNVTTSLDYQTPVVFDNYYYQNIQIYKGLLNSDQALYYQDKETKKLVDQFASDQSAFFKAFPIAMVNLANISPLEYPNGEIRSQCGYAN